MHTLIRALEPVSQLERILSNFDTLKISSLATLKMRVNIMTQRLRLKTTRFVDVHERIWAVGLSLNCGGGANVDQYTSLLAANSR